MKRAFAGALLVLAAFPVAAKADIQVNWFAGAGFYDNGQFGVDPGGGILFSGGSALAILIWTPDDSINLVDPNNGANGYVSGNDMFLDSLTFSAPAPYGDFSNGAEIYQDATYSAQLGTNVLANGFVYYRVFSDTTPQSGEAWYDTATTNVTLFSGTEIDLVNQTDPINGNELTVIVPEPSTLAFCAVGALLAGLRARRAKS
jgi:hypothetical protein